VTPSDLPESRLLLYEKNQSLGFFSLLFLAQALAKHGVTQPLLIQVLSNNMQRVVAEEAIAPEKSTLLGPCRVIPQEFPNIRCRSIDLLLPAQGSSQEAALIDLLIDEVASTSSDPIIAFRNGDRWVEGYEAMRIGANAKATSRLREGGVYLITGGLGGIGLELAGYLARTARAKLILTTRSAFPEEAERDDWIATHNEQDNVSRKINKVRELEKLGAEVLVIRADVADERRMGEAAALARSRFGVINGVIHAAGLAGGGLIQFKSPDAAATVLAPKVKGTLALEEVFKDARLDFLILFSSLTSMLGGFGQVDYCAANAFLDAFASRSAPAASAHTLTINWDTWREVGMALNTSIPVELKEHHEDLLKKAILSAEGVEVFSRILRSRLRRIIISTQELEAVIQESHSSASTADLQQLGKAMPPRAAHPRPSLGVAYVAPRNEVERGLANHWQKLLGIEQVGVHDNFFELGGHSLLAIQLISGARDSFQVEIPVNWIFDSPTIADLSVAVIQAQARQVDDEVMAEILAELAQISDEEAGSALADRGGIS
ncbi:MAG: SDR family NAD(P)-dependent oxidoreductase, partial [Blastocatellia bacterium]